MFPLLNVKSAYGDGIVADILKVADRNVIVTDILKVAERCHSNRHFESYRRRNDSAL